MRRVFLQPKQLAYLHHTDIHHLDGVIVQAQGYQRSAPVRVPALQRSSDTTGGMERWASLGCCAPYGVECCVILDSCSAQLPAAVVRVCTCIHLLWPKPGYAPNFQRLRTSV